MGDLRLETFLFGLTSGIAIAAAASYIASTYALCKSSSLPLQSSQTPGAAGSANADESRSSQSDIAKSLDRLERALTIPKLKLHEIVRHFVKEMQRGLASPNQTLKMIPHLGGSNFRVCEATLKGTGAATSTSSVTSPPMLGQSTSYPHSSGHIRMRQRKYTVSNELKVGTGRALFDFLADCVGEFLGEIGVNAVEGEDSQELALGFTFSFPCMQTAINKGNLMHWTKGFTATDVEGRDPVDLLQRAFLRKKLKIRVSALVNDTVGTLVSHAFQDPSTYISVILGTGSNAAPTKKMISGMYLGEIMRLAMLDLISTGELFSMESSANLDTPYSFDTANMSRIERDHSNELSDTKLVLEDLVGIPKTTVNDRRIVKRIAELIGTRSARLAAAGIAAIVTKINRLDFCTVAIDGSLFEHYPHYANRMRDSLREIIGLAEENISLVQAQDGSGQGAALVAALADV
ncbi:hypothetical protein BSLG_006800 [Batrachochytrium salamandrivorans]|nr:hypothetical protein BSLG_006800 [Batrachochytrium salamandrivorans]